MNRVVLLVGILGAEGLGLRLVLKNRNSGPVLGEVLSYTRQRRVRIVTDVGRNIVSFPSINIMKCKPLSAFREAG